LRCAPRPAAGRPSAGAAFGALVPVLSALLAIPLLGEWPSSADWAGIVVIATGVFLATGGEARLRRRSRQSGSFKTSGLMLVTLVE